MKRDYKAFDLYLPIYGATVTDDNPAASKGDWTSILGKRVRVWDGQHSSVRAEGEVIGVITAPTLCIRLDDGTIAHESSDLPVEYNYAEWRHLR